MATDLRSRRGPTHHDTCCRSGPTHQNHRWTPARPRASGFPTAGPLRLLPISEAWRAMASPLLSPSFLVWKRSRCGVASRGYPFTRPKATAATAATQNGSPRTRPATRRYRRGPGWTLVRAQDAARERPPLCRSVLRNPLLPAPCTGRHVWTPAAAPFASAYRHSSGEQY